MGITTHECDIYNPAWELEPMHVIHDGKYIPWMWLLKSSMGITSQWIPIMGFL